jgi:glutathione S-transferase
MTDDEKDASSVRITYFAFGGRATPIRLACILGQVSFDDEFMDHKTLVERQASGAMRWKGLPEMTVYDKDSNAMVTVGQSNACLRYVGTLGGLYPKDLFESALVDEVNDACEDMTGLISPTMHMKDDAEKKAAREALLVTDGYVLPYWIAKFETRFEENEQRGCTNGFIVGDSLSIADLKFYAVTMFFTSGFLDYIPTDIFTPHKRISAFTAKMAADERISNYLAGFQQRLADFKEQKGDACVKYGGKFCPGFV